MQAFFWLAVRAFTKLGIAIAASKPMMATTIMISTRVKPDLWDVLTFMLYLPFFGGVNAGDERLRLVLNYVHSLLITDRTTRKATPMPPPAHPGPLPSRFPYSLHHCTLCAPPFPHAQQHTRHGYFPLS